MAFSIEARVPFLDHRLVEFVFSLPSNYHIRDGWSKWILRQAMRNTLPQKVCWRRDKKGFPTPEGLWLQKAQNKIIDLFSNSNLRSRNYLNPKQVLTMLERQLTGQDVTDNHHIWRWINLELWMQRFDLN